MNGRPQDPNKPYEGQTYCAKCQRWYLMAIRHVCVIDVKRDDARKKLEKFLGDFKIVADVLTDCSSAN